MQPFEALHSSTQVRCLRCGAESSPPQLKSYNKVQTQDQVNFKDSSTSSASIRLANPIYRTPRFGIQHNPLTPLSRSLDPWHVLFSTRPRTLVIILTVLRCVICQTLPKTLPKTSPFGHCAPFLATIHTAIGEGATTSANTTTLFFSPPGTDLRMDWGGACSLGCLLDLNRNFLLVMDKDTEYFVSFPTKTRASPGPLALLKQFVTLIGRKIRYLRIDGAKEFPSHENQ